MEIIAAVVIITTTVLAVFCQCVTALFRPRTRRWREEKAVYRLSFWRLHAFVAVSAVGIFAWAGSYVSWTLVAIVNSAIALWLCYMSHKDVQVLRPEQDLREVIVGRSHLPTKH